MIILQHFIQPCSRKNDHSRLSAEGTPVQALNALSQGRNFPGCQKESAPGQGPIITDQVNVLEASAFISLLQPLTQQHLWMMVELHGDG